MNNQLIRGNLFLFSKPEPESKQFEKGERFFLNQAGTTESLFIVLRVTKENQLILARAFPTQQKNTCKVIILTAISPNSIYLRKTHHSKAQEVCPMM